MDNGRREAPAQWRDDAEFGSLLPLMSEPLKRSRKSTGARALAVGGGAVLLGTVLIYSTLGAKPPEGVIIGAGVLSIVAALAFRHAYRLLWGAGLPQFYEKGMVDRRRRIAY